MGYKTPVKLTILHWPRRCFAGLRAAQHALEVSLQCGLQREITGAIRRIDLLRELDNERLRPPEVPDTL